jgi:hypothetical protein
MSTELIRAKYRRGLFLIPKHMHGGVTRYMESGVMPGGFLVTMLAGDPEKAFTYADLANQHLQSEWEKYLAEYLPADAHGSPEKVKAWMARGGLSAGETT